MYHDSAGCSWSSRSYEEGNQGVLSYTADTAVISRVAFGGFLGPTAAQAVRYGVPKPATLGLMLFGALAAGVSRRRQQRRTP